MNNNVTGRLCTGPAQSLPRIQPFRAQRITRDPCRLSLVIAVACLGTLATAWIGAPALAEPVAETTIDVGETEVTVRADHVRESVYMITGQGGNIGLSVGKDGAFMIDDQYAPLTPAILEVVGRITDQPIRFVLNTHWHFDHVGGNENLGKAGSVIVAHDNVRERMSTQQVMAFFGRTVEASPPAALPVITFADGVTFHLNGDRVRAMHVAHAHTDGDAVVHFEDADVVHMGDVFWSASYPFIDSGSGGSIRGVVAAIDAVLPLITDDTHVIPGHGPLSDRAGLIAYRDMLDTVAGRIQSAIDAGESLEQTQAAGLTADWDEDWGQGFLKPDVWVKMIYEDLSR